MSGQADPIFAPTARRLESQHFIRTRLDSGHIAYTLTGIAVLSDMKGKGKDWFRASVEWIIGLPDLTPGKGLALVQWAPIVTLSSISNDDAAYDAGWAVDGFRLRETDRAHAHVTLAVDLAGRDIDGWILRLGYCVDVVGNEVAVQ